MAQSGQYRHYPRCGKSALDAGLENQNQQFAGTGGLSGHAHQPAAAGIEYEHLGRQWPLPFASS